MRIAFLLLMLSYSTHIALQAQPGCTDPLAINFNVNATSNDGSCQYPTTNLTPVFKTTVSNILDENSGLAWVNGALWAHNDGGSEPKIYRIDTLTNAILQTVTIEGAANTDWEDIAFDGANLYIGDFGNNANGNRTDLRIYKFPIAAIPSGPEVTVPAGVVEQINFAYQDQTNFDPTGSNNTRFDCEAMLFYNNQLHLFTKNWVEKTSSHYTLPATAGTFSAQKLETFNVDGLVTAADMSASGVLMLLGYDLSAASAFFWQIWDNSNGLFFSGNKRRVELGSVLATGQVEGLCFRNNRYGYFSNEKTAGIIPARLYSFELGLNLLTPARELYSNSSSTWCANLPNPVTAVQLREFVGKTESGGVVEIWNFQGQLVWRSNALVSDATNAASPGLHFLQARDAQGHGLCQRVVLVH
ncbi:MAG: hypothetical protein IPM36_14495 [Lewinellaceae bacterium]|nr:hypothetical protein [Lewinellaceae bacterium]